MGWLTLEHSKAAYRADLALHTGAVLALAGALCRGVPPERALQSIATVVLGLAGWTAIEYALHRFILHGLQPFQRWHAAHHERPAARIYAPTLLIAALMFLLVFLPARALGDAWFACALTLGVLAGYLAYAATHHATHHGPARSAWLKQRRQHHALHHRRAARPVCYGVTSAFWDRAFGSL